MLRNTRNKIEESLSEALEEAELDAESVVGDDLIELKDYDDREKGTFASPVAFRLAGVAGKPPAEVAELIVETQRDLGLPSIVTEVTIDDGYINYYVDQGELTATTVENVLTEAADYGEVTLEDPDTIVADVSSPNICKPMHVGHLRNNVLSDALTRILSSQGHEVIRDNHLGDWGTQFGNLMYWFTEHGDREKLEENPIEHLLDLYQEFGQYEAKLDDEGREEELEELRENGREWFARVEEEEEEAVELWQLFREVSIERFEETYDLLGMDFDKWNGEAWYALNGWNDRVLEVAREQDAVIETDDGMVYIPIYPGDTEGVEDPETANVDKSLDRAREAEAADDEETDVDRLVLLKSDGATTYGTRDLATVLYRDEELDADRSIYVVANEQDEYFQQMFAGARKLGKDDLTFKHVSYGLISLPEGSMSTRRDRVVRARTVIEEAIDRAEDVVAEKNPDLDPEKRREIAKKVGMGTVKFENICVSRDKDVTFNLEEAVSFEGDTGPYVQYSDTRARSILDKVDEFPDVEKFDPEALNQLDHDLARVLAVYPNVLESCEQRYDAARLVHYLLDLAQLFNSYYHKNRVLDAEDTRDERILLTAATHQVFENALGLVGMDTIDRM